MRVKHSRPAQGGFFGASNTESMIEELPDTDVDGHPTAVPAGAVLVDNTTPLHSWQRDAMGGFPSMGGN